VSLIVGPGNKKTMMVKFTLLKHRERQKATPRHIKRNRALYLLRCHDYHDLADKVALRWAQRDIQEMI
jgi:hypothetical protein